LCSLATCFGRPPLFSGFAWDNRGFCILEIIGDYESVK
jgi:hypothetical protein